MVYSRESVESNEGYVKENLRKIVLAILEREPLCGYDLIKTIYQRFNITVSQGTVYPLLYSLQGNGILDCKEKIGGGKRVKVYSLTDKGKKLVNEKSREIAAVRRKLGLRSR